jgi:hypothetical protein
LLKPARVDSALPPRTMTAATIGDRADVDAAWLQMVEDTANAWRTP